MTEKMNYGIMARSHFWGYIWGYIEKAKSATMRIYIETNVYSITSGKGGK